MHIKWTLEEGMNAMSDEEVLGLAGGKDQILARIANRINNHNRNLTDERHQVVLVQHNNALMTSDGICSSKDIEELTPTQVDGLAFSLGCTALELMFGDGFQASLDDPRFHTWCTRGLADRWESSTSFSEGSTLSAEVMLTASTSLYLTMRALIWGREKIEKTQKYGEIVQRHQERFRRRLGAINGSSSPLALESSS